MDPMELLKAALYGLVEGVTEWLPISSTGHLLLLDQFISLDVSPEFWDLFLVVVQLGAILAVCVLFFRQLNPFAPSKGVEGRRETWALWGKIVLACIPAAVVGIPLDDWMEEHLSGPFTIAAALIVYGIAFIWVEGAREKKARELALSSMRMKHLRKVAQPQSAAELADMDASVQSIETLDVRRAFGIGCFQVLSLVPGTSRSGSTILGGLLLGTSRTVAAEFTFYLAIPVMFGASLVRVAKYALQGFAPTSGELSILVVGCVVAFIVSILAVKFLLAFVRRHDFKPFGWYRIVLGVVVIAYFALLAR